MSKEIINEWLSDIATPTGISYSGDRTISKSMAEKIVDYVSNLEQTLDEIKKYLKNNIESCNSSLSNPEYTIISKHELLKNEKQKDIDILKIIQKAKGDVKNEN